MKKLLLILCFLFPITAFCLPQSINAFLVANPKWANESSSQNFLAGRCAALNTLVIERLKTMDKQEPELLKQYEDAKLFFFTFANLAAAMGKISIEQSDTRMMHWVKLYAKEATNNWTNYNNMMQGQIADDLMACNKVVIVKLSNYVDEVCNSKKDLCK
jgi:hypothetical protein